MINPNRTDCGKRQKNIYGPLPVDSRIFLFLFPLVFSIFFLFSPPFLSASEAHNKTPYIRPAKEEILKRLEESRKLAEKYPDSEIVCTFQEISIEIHWDYSCRIAETKEFYLKKKQKAFPFAELKNSYIEQFFPGGYYRESNSPETVFLPENSLFIHKFSRFIRGGKKEDFLVELFLDQPIPVAKSVLRIAYAKNMRIYHGLTPPYSGRIPPVKKMRKNTYIIENISAYKSRKSDERIRFHASGIASWRMLGDILIEKKQKALRHFPAMPSFPGTLSPYKKALFLYEKAKLLKGKNRESILQNWLTQAGIRSCTALGKEVRNLNMSTACNFFTYPLVFIEQQNGFPKELWLDLSAKKAGEVQMQEERNVVLLLEKGRSKIMFITKKKTK